MKAELYLITGEKKGQVDLPTQFSEPVRFDLIKRAVFSIQTKKRQAYGSDPNAGTKQGAATTKRRQKYKTTYGKGVSRIKRKYSFSRGMQFGFIGAFVANAISGRKAFPPKSEKVLIENKNVSRKLARNYYPGIYSEKVFLIQCKGEVEGAILNKTKTNLFRRYVKGEILVEQVDTIHEEMLNEPFVDEITEKINSFLLIDTKS